MTPDQIRTLLEDVRRGTVSPDDAQQRISAHLRRAPFEDLGFARIDHHRATRQGVPEVIFGQGKTPDQIAAIADRIVQGGHSLLVTRSDRDAFARVLRVAPAAEYHETARAITLQQGDVPAGNGTILIVSAGTSDLPVAEEAAVTAEAMGNHVERVFDCGVAGLHRLVPHLDRLNEANAIIAVAGMEGALPSVLGGLVDRPVIAVPTSVGYGASFGGVAALLAMLNSCAPGVSVVNIDNGYGAAAQANQINKLASKLR